MSLARSTDPISSHIAGEEAEARGLVRKQQIKACEMLFDFEQGNDRAGTINEIAEFYAVKIWKKYSDDPTAHAALVHGEIVKKKHMLGRRLPELHREGLVTIEGVAICKVSNRQCQLWQLTAIGHGAVKGLRGL